MDIRKFFYIIDQDDHAENALRGYFKTDNDAEITSSTLANIIVAQQDHDTLEETSIISSLSVTVYEQKIVFFEGELVELHHRVGDFWVDLTTTEFFSGEVG